MNIQMHGTDIELTNTIEEYARKKAKNLEKILFKNLDTTFVRIEFGHDVGSHKTGEIFKTEINVDSFGQVFRTSSVGINLYATIDDSLDEMQQVIKKVKGKKETLWRRGSASIKRILKGFKK